MRNLQNKRVQQTTLNQKERGQPCPRGAGIQFNHEWTRINTLCDTPVKSGSKRAAVQTLRALQKHQVIAKRLDCGAFTAALVEPDSRGHGCPRSARFVTCV